MSRSRRAALGFALAGALLTNLASADPGEATAAIESGIAFRRKHMDIEALTDFRRAYALEPTPRALAQIALAEGALMRWVPAEIDLLRALAAENEWIDRQRAILQIALKEIQSHLSTLEITGPDRAEVWIDGVFVTLLPTQPLRVTAKHFAVELRAPGFQTARREVDAAQGTVERETFALQAAPSAAPLPALQVMAVRSEASHHTPALQRTLAWASAGAAVAFLGGGVVSTFYAADRASRYNDNSSCLQPTKSITCKSYVTQLDTAEALEAVAYSASVLAASASTVTFLTLPRRDRTHAGGWCLPAIGGVACGYTY